MTARDFCYWLQGFFELGGEGTQAGLPLTARQADMIRRHLSMVFAHDIDPKAGGKEMQDELNKLHAATATNPKDWIARC
jgi:hypothetical protein